MSIHLQTWSPLRLPTQGGWKVWLKDVVVMSTDVGLIRMKGTHSHWGVIEIVCTQLQKMKNFKIQVSLVTWRLRNNPPDDVIVVSSMGLYLPG